MRDREAGRFDRDLDEAVDGFGGYGRCAEAGVYARGFACALVFDVVVFKAGKVAVGSAVVVC